MCPACGHAGSDVIDSRKKEDRIYRRRCCQSCGERWSTEEVPASELRRLEDFEAVIKSAVRNVL